MNQLTIGFISEQQARELNNAYVESALDCYKRYKGEPSCTSYSDDEKIRRGMLVLAVHHDKSAGPKFIIAKVVSNTKHRILGDILIRITDGKHTWLVLGSVTPVEGVVVTPSKQAAPAKQTFEALTGTFLRGKFDGQLVSAFKAMGTAKAQQYISALRNGVLVALPEANTITKAQAAKLVAMGYSDHKFSVK